MAIIDHIGIAVNSLDTAMPLYSAILGENALRVEEVPSEEVRVALYGEGAGRVELLEPTTPDSPVSRFLARRGAGLHHVCLRVPDVEAALARACAAGAEPIPPGLRRGVGGSRIAFLHPRSTGGVLVELRETPPAR